LKERPIKVNAILNVLKTVLGIIFPLITFPYISRVLQVESIGAYDFSASVISYFALMAGLGISTYAIREGTKCRDNQKEMESFISEVFSINIISTVISYILLCFTVMCVDKIHSYYHIILILSIEIFFTTLSVSWICNIYEDFLFIALQSIGVHAISLLLTVLLVKQSTDLDLYAMIVVLSRSISGTINFFYVRKKYCRFKLTFKINWNRHFKPIMIMFSINVAIIIYVSADTTMLGIMTNDYQVGLYGFAVKIYTIIKNILAAALVVLIPRFSILLNSSDIKRGELNVLFSGVFKALMFIMLPAIVGLFLVSKDVIHLIGGINYLAGTKSLQLLCIAIFFSLLAYMYIQCILIPSKKEKEVFVATLVSALVNVGLNFIFIPLWGIEGAAVTTIVAEVTVCIISYLYSRKYIALVGIKKDLIKVIWGCLGIILVYYLCSFINNGFILRLMITIIASGIVYFVIEMICRNSILVEYTFKLSQRFNKRRN